MVFIGIAPQAEFFIDDSQRMGIRKISPVNSEPINFIDLGVGTTENFERVIYFMTQLKHQTIPEKDFHGPDALRPGSQSIFSE